MSRPLSGRDIKMTAIAKFRFFFQITTTVKISDGIFYFYLDQILTTFNMLKIMSEVVHDN
jgi:hypothetical protein